MTGTVRVKAPAVNVTVALRAPALSAALLTVKATTSVGFPGVSEPAVGVTLSQPGSAPV